MLQRVVRICFQVDAGVVVAELDAAAVDPQVGARVGEPGAEGHIVRYGVGQYRGDLHGMPFRVDSFDHDERVVFVRVRRKGSGHSGDPLAFGNERVG